MALRPRAWTLFAALGGTFVTLLVMELEQLQFAYRAFGLHVALETAASFVAFLAAHLFYGRFRQSGRVDDLALTLSLGVIACANVFFSAIPAAVSNGSPAPFATWAPLSGRLIGEALFAFAAFAPPSRLAHPARTARFAILGCFGLLAAVAIGFGASASHLPAGIDPNMAPGRADVLAAPLVIPAVQAVGILLYSAAAVGFTRRAEAARDDFMLFLAVGAILAAVARWNYLLYPSLYAPWVYVGDAFRLASYVVIWFGAAREIGSYWRSRAEKAVLEERRRLARDLHDGVAQELGFIATRAQELASSTDVEARRIAAAAERGLDEARRAIAALTRAVDEPLDVALAQAAEEVAARVGARVRLSLDPAADVPATTREELLRIVREAVTNATRHGSASSISVELENGDGLSLRIADDGVGFEPSRARTGFGLVSMRDRARALGGDLRITSAPGEGTAIEVVLPEPPRFACSWPTTTCRRASASGSRSTATGSRCAPKPATPTRPWPRPRASAPTSASSTSECRETGSPPPPRSSCACRRPRSSC
jgi:signal transduction histidine kinase